MGGVISCCCSGVAVIVDPDAPARHGVYVNGVRLREIRFQQPLESEPDQPSPPCLSCAESPATCDEASGMVAEGGCAFACSLAGGGTEADHAWLAAAYSGFGCGALTAESAAHFASVGRREVSAHVVVAIREGS